MESQHVTLFRKLLLQTIELRIPPVAISVIFAVIMWLVSTFIPSLALAIPWRYTFTFLFVGIGIMFVITGVITFRKAKTTINPMKPESTSVLVTSSVYGLSRNPMYVGLLFVLAGWAIFLANFCSFFFLPAFILYMNRFQIVPEEKTLLIQFENDYATYMRSVRRWL